MAARESHSLNRQRKENNSFLPQTDPGVVASATMGPGSKGPEQQTTRSLGMPRRVGVEACNCQKTSHAQQIPAPALGLPFGTLQLVLQGEHLLLHLATLSVPFGLAKPGTGGGLVGGELVLVADAIEGGRVCWGPLRLSGPIAEGQKGGPDQQHAEDQHGHRQRETQRKGRFFRSVGYLLSHDLSSVMIAAVELSVVDADQVGVHVFVNVVGDEARVAIEKSNIHAASV